MTVEQMLEIKRLITAKVETQKEYLIHLNVIVPNLTQKQVDKLVLITQAFLTNNVENSVVCPLWEEV